VQEVRRLTKVENFDLAVVLGSGWSGAAQIGETLGILQYRDWPCFPAGQVAGHGGHLVAVQASSWKILFFVGRFHYYQGISAFQAAFPVRLASALGCPRLLLTCATGGINSTYRPGDFMLVEDHLNLLGDNPLRGLPGDTFVDLVGTYQHDLYDSLMTRGADLPVLHRGVLAAMSGPSYETPAEVRFLAAAGVDAVSMSTVPEAIMARYLGMQVAAIAFIANTAAGLTSAALSHQDVLACSSEHAQLFPCLVGHLIDTWQALLTGPPG
jgi:purine-nucleoside phosphorylase